MLSLFTFLSRSATLLCVFLALVVGAVFGLPFVNGQSLQAQADAALPLPRSHPAQGWEAASDSLAVAAVQAR